MQHGPDYYSIVKWCVENGLVQQALTIFTEKIPSYIIGKNYMKVSDAVITECKNKKQQYDWEYIAIWNIFLGREKDPRTEDALVIEFKNVLLNGKKTNNEKIKSVVSYIRKNIPISIQVNDLKGKYECLRKCLINNGNRVKITEGFYKSICNSTSTVYTLLDKPCNRKSTSERKEKNLSLRFSKLKDLKREDVSSDYTIADIEKIKKILFGYIYVKSVRNLTNHASSDAVMNEEQKNYLASYGYSFDDFSLNTVRKNILIALEELNDKNNEEETLKAENGVEDNACYFTPDDKIYSNLKLGDEVEAYVKNAKTKDVRINGFDYDIKVIVPGNLWLADYLNSKIKVTVHQIAKTSGRIIQVKMLKETKKEICILPESIHYGISR